jgi:hypothetical protein
VTKLSQSTIDAISAAVAAALIAQGKPASARAASPVGPVKFADTAFGAAVLAKQAAKVPCTVHAAGSCTRRFSPTSAGLANHEARIV